MSSVTRKILRNIVRCSAEKNGMKPSKAVHHWRRIVSEVNKRRNQGTGGQRK